MRHFLIRDDNELSSLDSFEVIRTPPQIQTKRLLGGKAIQYETKGIDFFSCEYTGQIPNPMLVVDETAKVYTCLPSVANLGSRGFKLSGPITHEDYATERDAALEHIQKYIDAKNK